LSEGKKSRGGEALGDPTSMIKNPSSIRGRLERGRKRKGAASKSLWPEQRGKNTLGKWK